MSINFKKNIFTKDNFLKFLKKNKIISQFHYIPIYKFKTFNERKYHHKGAEEYYKKTVTEADKFLVSLGYLKEGPVVEIE